jgi:SAM-dependent methyltransferase
MNRLQGVLKRTTYALLNGYWHTGERCCSDFPDEHFHNHFRVYRFASQFCVNRRVLDVGCGTGYGTAYLAKLARTAVGIDLSRQAIQHARKHYRHPNLQFLQMNAESLAFLHSSFDFVISSENFEHLIDQRKNLEEMARVLSKDGMMLLGTPNPEMFVGQTNAYHTRELAYADLRGMLEDFFGEYQISETLLVPPTVAGRHMQEERLKRGEFGISLLRESFLWGQTIDTTWLSNTHSFLCLAKAPHHNL